MLVVTCAMQCACCSYVPQNSCVNLRVFNLSVASVCAICWGVFAATCMLPVLLALCLLVACVLLMCVRVLHISSYMPIFLDCPLPAVYGILSAVRATAIATATRWALPVSAGVVIPSKRNDNM